MINSLLLGTNNCKFPNDPICSAWVGQYTGAEFSYHFGDGHHEGHWKSPLLRCASRIEKFPNIKSMFQHDHGMPSNEPKDLSMAKTSCPNRYSKTVTSTIQPNSPPKPTATTVPSRFDFFGCVLWPGNEDSNLICEVGPFVPPWFWCSKWGKPTGRDWEIRPDQGKGDPLPACEMCILKWYWFMKMD